MPGSLARRLLLASALLLVTFLGLAGAALAYEQALAADPAHDDAAHNLALARALLARLEQAAHEERQEQEARREASSEAGGEPIPDATITVTSAELPSFSKTTTTNDDGEFKILILDAKPKFSKQGLFIQGWKDLYGYETDNSMIEWRGSAQGSNDNQVVKVDLGRLVKRTAFDPAQVTMP